jgi:hypothetical protein
MQYYAVSTENSRNMDLEDCLYTHSAVQRGLGTENILLTHREINNTIQIMVSVMMKLSLQLKKTASFSSLPSISEFSKGQPGSNGNTGKNSEEHLLCT